ncbi:MAG: DUF3098 domain-containing protein [Bacteroidales bacterium]|nr:DUF3098 domain-containing protein [Bacteroidales bacterium]
MSQKSIALSRRNLIICGIAILLIIVGFVLMAGPATTLEGGFEADIFSARRIKLAPVVCLSGFVLMVVGILYPSKEKNNSSEK